MLARRLTGEPSHRHQVGLVDAINGVDQECWAHSVWPEGRYVVFFVTNMSQGLFGDPVQQTLCVFGGELLAAVTANLPACLAAPLRRND